jgi:hypothetical protein
MSGPPAAKVEAAQRAVAVIAARDRGDLGAAEDLLSSFSCDADKASGFYFLSEVLVRLLATSLDQDMAACASDIAMTLAVVGAGDNG